MRKAIAMMRRSCRCSSALAFCVRRRFGKTKNVTKYVRRHFDETKCVTKYVRRHFGEWLQPPTKLHKLTNHPKHKFTNQMPQTPPNTAFLWKGGPGENLSFGTKERFSPGKNKNLKRHAIDHIMRTAQAVHEREGGGAVGIWERSAAFEVLKASHNVE